ncbi:MAG: TIGR02281 family clan AA aspartic protease [Bauldia sp.]|nr:TIGR02281 family clan AA aspartic protease [Bauldia sp.]
MFPVRLIVVAAAIAAVAVAAPKFAPGLIDGLVHDRTAEAPAAQSRDAPAVGRHQVAVRADRSGHYLVDAVIDGHAVEAIVDTGATTVALTSETARRLGLVPAQSDYTLEIRTANGVVAAAPVTLSEVRLDRISVRNVEAVVVPGDALPVNLLGMSFLGRLTKFESGGGELVLVE